MVEYGILLSSIGNWFHALYLDPKGPLLIAFVALAVGFLAAQLLKPPKI